MQCRLVDVSVGLDMSLATVPAYDTEARARCRKMREEGKKRAADELALLCNVADAAFRLTTKGKSPWEKIKDWLVESLS